MTHIRGFLGFSFIIDLKLCYKYLGTYLKHENYFSLVGEILSEDH